MKLTLKESIEPRYLYINPKTNMVHLLLPIMSGSEIGSDNTCKSVYSLQEFFGYAGANEQKTALSELMQYQAALESDIKYLSADSQIRKEKEERLSQIRMYLHILKPIQNQEQLEKPLHLAFPLYPKPVEKLMQRADANLHSIILRPLEEDVQLRTTAIKPVFSANHSLIVNGHVVRKESLLCEGLAQNYQGLNLRAKTKEQVIERVLTKLKNSAVDFEHIKAMLSSEVEKCLGKDYKSSFDKTQKLVEVTQAYMDEQLGYTPETNEEYVNALIHYCAPNLFHFAADSPFYSIDSEARLIVVTQFFLAELNLLCHTQGWTKSNFGQILEGQPELVIALAHTVKKALSEQACVEEALIGYVNTHQQAFQLAQPIPQEQSASLKARFTSHYNSIKGSPHFDEFMFLSDKPGLFVTRFSFICAHFAQFMHTGFFKLTPADQEFLQQTQADFATVDKPHNQLPHYNQQVKAEVELDLSKMDNSALQSLYEDINAYEDNKTKETLLTQFKQEAPEFKPQINAKAFLQHVAYGQQKEAETLLKKNPELAQELLKAHNSAFTDYSGRTFACTAYEYAYWARDSHMQRMLEQYMDSDTKQFILKRVLDIEKPENPNTSPDFFPNPNAPLKRNKGLNYTTKGENREIIQHNEPHFSLQPLIDALEHYIKAYDESPKATDADWDTLENIWVKEVGGAQRQVPAHIAQEYCHPNRSFEQVTNNKALLDASHPDNLQRQLRFYNYDTNNYDLWFTPDSVDANSGLGFSIAILRAEWDGGAWGGGRDDVAGEYVDLAALKAIDEVRASDLKQSLHNLSQSLIVHQSHSHGF